MLLTKVPGATQLPRAWHCAAPGGLNKLGGHGRHDKTLAPPVAGLYVPAVHGVCVALVEADGQ